MNKYYVLALDYDIRLYKAQWKGDPGRTYDLHHATRYSSLKVAKSVLTKIRNMYGREFKGAKILELKLHDV